jgi:riboflavin synthase
MSSLEQESDRDGKKVFTGIVAALGEVRGINSLSDSIRLTVAVPQLAAELKRGDSIAVNGACLTAVELSPDSFTADVMRETLAKTALGELNPGSQVNLELPMRPSDRLGGHMVLGHIDGVGKIRSRDRSDNWDWIRVALPEHLMKYVVHKGSIAIDGVSLTVNELAENEVGFSLIPETLASTTLGIKQVGDLVNVEVDIMAKHIERLLGARS